MKSSSRAGRYIGNVLWNWAGVGVGILVGLFISPYIICKVGDVDFAIWTLTLSLIDYYWLIDFGFRSATVKLSAEYRTLGDIRKLNELLSTGLFYSAAAGVFVLGVTFLLASRAGALLHVAQPVFPQLILITGASWSLGLIFNMFAACLEGYQRFDIFSRAWIVTVALRSLAFILLLRAGYGVLQMGMVLLISQIAMYVWTYIGFRRVVTGVHPSWRGATLPMLRAMAGYGVHTFTALTANRLLAQGAPLLIAYYLPVRFVGYYAVASRLFDYAMDGIGRVGTVTSPNATEMMAAGHRQELIELGVFSNRYCLTMFMPLTAFLLVYGMELYSVWIRPEFARESAYLLPVLLIGYTVLAGQFNSASMLFGMSRHRTYSRYLMAEALLVIAGITWALPRYGLFGCALVSSITMALNRGGIVCWLTARELGLAPLRYAARIYLPPAIAGTAMFLTGAVLKHWGLAGRNWSEIALAAALMGTVYVILAFWLCVPRQHRHMVLSRLMYARQAAAVTR